MTRAIPASLFCALCLFACTGDEGPEADTADTADGGIDVGTDGDTNGPNVSSGSTGGEESGSSGGSGESGNAPSCGEATFVLEHTPANVMLVLDKSHSMVDPENLWDHDDDPQTDDVTRWSSLHASASFLVDEFDNGLNFGAVLFPSADVPNNAWETACDVAQEPEVPAAPENGEAIMQMLPDADDVELFGGTPTGAGVGTALAHLDSLDSQLPRALILLTDGAANCFEGTEGTDVFREYDENLPGQIAEAFEGGTPTYVIGIDILDENGNIPNANPFERLNEVAIAGGHPKQGPEKFYNARDEDELRAAMSQISSQIGCVIPLDQEPSDPELLEVHIDGELVPFVDSCDDAAFGWHFQEPEGPYDTVVLCADACSAMHNSGEMSVEYVCVDVG